MKKIFLLFGLAINSFNAQAQTITITNSPVVGDVNNLRFCDSVGIIPKNTGAGSLWDFSSC
ncbi:MAG: hypothetical protein JNM96_03310, partial [Bacteroidia bacterium]|nr:hypothetical protein [Bacteroidia bacterium]